MTAGPYSQTFQHYSPAVHDVAVRRNLAVTTAVSSPHHTMAIQSIHQSPHAPLTMAPVPTRLVAPASPLVQSPRGPFASVAGSTSAAPATDTSNGTVPVCFLY